MQVLSFVRLGVAAAIAAATPGGAADLAPPPAELKQVFESYTRHAGIDANACSFGVWDRNVAGLAAKEAMDNAFARCTLPKGFKVCTRIAGDYPDPAAVENGCITGFERASLLALAAVSPEGGFFIVVYDAPGRPVRLSQQLSLGFGKARDFCELSARLIDADAKLVAGTTYHAFTDLLVDKNACKGRGDAAPQGFRPSATP